MQAFAETFAHLLAAAESAEFHPYHATASKTGAGSSLLTLQATFALADVVRKTQDKQADKEKRTHFTVSLERTTGLEPAMTSLEGWCLTKLDDIRAYKNTTKAHGFNGADGGP